MKEKLGTTLTLETRYPGKTTSITVDTSSWDLQIDELVDMFKSLAIADGYSHINVEDALGQSNYDEEENETSD